MRISRATKTWIAAVMLVASSSAFAGVEVTFAKPEEFSDLPFKPHERQDVLKGLAEHFQFLGKRLRPGQELKIEVTDVDMAGREEPGRHGGRDLRVLNGQSDWPRMRLRYVLEQNGKVIASGESAMSDMAYLQRLNRYSSGDALRYEKQLIDDWFKSAFDITPKGRSNPVSSLTPPQVQGK
jgi:hypothetical protein